jgi:hypothetical protein
MDNNKPICKVDTNGSKFWYLNRKLHREDGPAIEYTNSYKEWWLNGHRHREDGPAVEEINGHKEWYLNGYPYTFQDYLKKLKEMSKDDKDIFLIQLKYK